MALGTKSMSREITIDELISIYANKLWENGTHKNSAILYLEEIAGIMTKQFSRIEASDYDAITEVLIKRGNKNSTANRKIFALTKLLRQAQDDNLIPHVPIFKRLKENANNLRYLSPDEEMSLIMALRETNVHYSELAIFLVDTGVTLGEAISLRWESTTNNHVTIQESSMGLGRTLPLTKRCQTLLHNYETNSKGPFSTILQPKFRLTWNQAKQNLQFGEDGWIVPTVLRHTCASRLILSGLDLRLVQRWLGNRNYKSMIRYERLCNLNDFELCVSALMSYNTEFQSALY